MRYSAKAILRRLIRTCGYDLVKYSESQRMVLKSNPDFHYRGFVVEETMNLPGAISLGEAKFLGQLVGDLEVTNNGPIIEIGTLFGWSTRVMVLHKSVDRDLITVDNYSWNPLGLSAAMHLRIAEKTLSEALKRFSVKQAIMNKDDFYWSYDGDTPAMVFLDALHTYESTKADILWAKRAKANLICGHDYSHEEFPGVVRAVDEFGGPRELVESLWVL